MTAFPLVRLEEDDGQDQGFIRDILKVILGNQTDGDMIYQHIDVFGEDDKLRNVHCVSPFLASK
ncbi:MAG: hypothetical protein A3I29_00085 [Candidatus Magasanikbacteria bacterium RIFCSPLOWO2_02_FULL_44_11]|uniref:Uncharacterized protein n=2 Tax=Candidatus Magasanikiibacteriota TaxID=1752731 RepID=A0A1F6NBP6_9BACT|nr:MAG: hypothetical protein A3D53_01750 [Candidatus Magasanikbacteria bacterium RIFCSPHIGHO2_02_FULL_45_10]OGH81366.1 MAG: hypothetical protein A3I29_00085 [Candidatus Magasanikbacteria bacterium RIFCSPLOWO2_02_FULL_44_11]